MSVIIVSDLKELGAYCYMKPPEIDFTNFKIPTHRFPIPRTWSGITYYYDNEENRNFVKLMREVYNVDVGATFVRLENKEK